MNPATCKYVGIAMLAFIAAVSASADVVMTADGAKLVGTIKSITGGVVTLDTTYAGTLSIKQKAVVSIETSQPDSVRLTGGARADGTVTTQPGGAVQVAGPAGTVTTSVANVSNLWPMGGHDPLAGQWSYEATVNIAGAEGNTNSLDTGAGFKAEYVSPDVTFKYYGNYDRAETAGVESSDQLHAGVDYAYNFTADQQWFLRDDAGFDHVMGIRLQDVAAGGYGFDFIKTTSDVLLGRIGLAYRYDNYSTPDTPNVSTMAGDFELDHDYKGKVVEVNNAITFVPSLQQFSNFLVTQDSWVQLPLTGTNFKLRAGLSNNYDSKPGPGIKKLDSLYYLRLVLDFGSAPAAP